jgi:hypothetical protein
MRTDGAAGNPRRLLRSQSEIKSGSRRHIDRRSLVQLLISGLQLLAGPGRSERAAAGAPVDALMLSVR